MLKTRIYNCHIFHSRNLPVSHQFSYSSFNFCIDLDEVESLSQKSIFCGTERFRPFRFVPEDSIFSKKGDSAIDLKRSVIQYAQQKGISAPVARVEFLGNIRTFGYSYNPASFFFGYSHDGNPLFAIVEVTNTFKGKKTYFVPMNENKLRLSQEKLFYVSPFSDLDSQFEFSLCAPTNKLSIQIDSIKRVNTDSTVKVHATLSGFALPFCTLTLIRAMIRYPFVPLVVMIQIHFQALRLYLKGAPFKKKNSQINLQKGGLS